MEGHVGRWVGLPETEVDFYSLAVVVEEVKPVVLPGKAKGGPLEWRGGSGLQLHSPEIRTLPLQDFRGGGGGV